MKFQQKISIPKNLISWHKNGHTICLNLTTLNYTTGDIFKVFTSCMHDDLLWDSIFQFIIVFLNSYLTCALSHTHTCLCMSKVTGLKNLEC